MQLFVFFLKENLNITKEVTELYLIFYKFEYLS